jgi:alpha-tubulin suppressor-like RCC1 family protein
MRLQLGMVVIASSVIAAGACGSEEVKEADATSGGEAFAPAKEAMLVAGNGQSCGLRAGGALYCWGKNAEQVPDGRYHRVSLGFDHGCAIRGEEPRLGELDCWGRNDKEQATPPAGKFIEVAAGYAHTCALRPDGTAACFGRDVKGASKPPAGTRFTAISAGKGFSCGLTKADASVECWGDDDTEQSSGAIGHFVMLSSGPHYSCALSEDGTLECWGLDKSAKGLKVPEGRFRAVAVGLERACGILRDDKAVCFGSEGAGEISAPDGEYFALTSGWLHACGILRDGEVQCWGNDFNGESQPHAQFTHVTVPGGSSRPKDDGNEQKAAAAKPAEKAPKPAKDGWARSEPAEEPEPAVKETGAAAAKTGKPDQAPPPAAEGDTDMSFDLAETEGEPAKPKTKAEEAREQRAKDKEKARPLEDFLK